MWMFDLVIWIGDVIVFCMFFFFGIQSVLDPFQNVESSSMFLLMQDVVVAFALAKRKKHLCDEYLSTKAKSSAKDYKDL